MMKKQKELDNLLVTLRLYLPLLPLILLMRMLVASEKPIEEVVVSDEFREALKKCIELGQELEKSLEEIDKLAFGKPIKVLGNN